MNPFKGAVIFLAVFMSTCGAVRAEEFSMAQAREIMVEKQLRQRGVRDERVLEAMRKVERHLFVPSGIARLAYEDSALPIEHGQTISQPFIAASMTEALKLGPNDRVLEIGTGSGYQAAILAELVKEVYSMEIVPGLAGQAQKRLHELGYKNIRVKQGDGYTGWPEHAPFDAIILTAAPESLPEKLTGQLKEGGRLIVPVGPAQSQELRLYTKTGNSLKEELLYPVKFVPMIREKSKNRIEPFSPPG